MPMIEALSLNLYKQYKKKWNNSKINVVPLFLHAPLHCELPVASRHGIAFHYLVARVGEVVALDGCLQQVAADAECLAEFEVDGVPVAEHVGLIV